MEVVRTPITDFKVINCVKYLDPNWERQFHKTILFVDTPDGIRSLCEFLDARHAFLMKAGAKPESET